MILKEIEGIPGEREDYMEEAEFYSGKKGNSNGKDGYGGKYG